MRLLSALFLTVLTALLCVSPAFAQGEFLEEEGSIYTYPEVPPAYNVWAGYWFPNRSGSKRAGEYVFFESSPTGGLEMTIFPFPHRVHLELDIANKKDYFADLRYAYKDLVIVRGVPRSIFHNFNNIVLVPPGTVSRLDVGADYGLRAAFGNVHARLKPPEYPLHIYANVWYMDKEGIRQNRFLGGSAFFDNRVRVSQQRTINWLTTDVTAGINGHFGPVEADYSHSARKFEPGGPIPGFAYAAAGGGFVRPAGTYPHNVVPELVGATDTVKLHTNYTGRLAASTTFSILRENNEYSTANYNNYLASAEVIWVPVAEVTGVMKYRYEKRNVRNPQGLPAGYLGFTDFLALTGIRNSISSQINTFSTNVRYRPMKRVTVGAEASFSHTGRENAQEWGLHGATNESILGASVSARLPKRVKVRAKYRYRKFDMPAYNTQPDYSHSADVSITWMPVTRVSVFGGYGIVGEYRGDLHILVEGIDVGAHGRHVRRDNINAGVTIMVVDNVSLTLGFGHWENKIKQAAAYGNSTVPASPFLDPDVRYADIATNYTASVHCEPIKKLRLVGSIGYTVAETDFTPSIAAATLPVPLSQISRLKITERAFGVGANYTFPKDIHVAFNFDYRDFRDRISNPANPEEQSSVVQLYKVTVGKRW